MMDSHAEHEDSEDEVETAELWFYVPIYLAVEMDLERAYDLCGVWEIAGDVNDGFFDRWDPVSKVWVDCDRTDNEFCADRMEYRPFAALGPD